MQIWSEWRGYFEQNAQRQMPAVAKEIALAPALLESLQKFQLGETGEGRIAQQIDRLRSTAIDDDYRAALKLFVKEEGRHARILASVLHSAGSNTLKHTATASAFTVARRLMGVRFKLIVLLVAEVVAIEAYPVLLRAFGGNANARALEQIASDERRHLQFHICFFKRALRGYKRWLFGPVFLAITTVAALLCAWDHRHTWKLVGMKPTQLFARMWRRGLSVLREV